MMGQPQVDYRRIQIFDQFDYYFDNIIKKHKTANAICGYIVMAIANYICNNEYTSMKQIIKSLNRTAITQNIQYVMIWLQQKRLKYTKSVQMDKKQQKKYIADWVANYEIQDYLTQFSSGFINKNVFFFRHVAYDHPQQVVKVKNQEYQRIQFEKEFIGQQYFITKFNKTQHLKHQQLIQCLRNCNKQYPIVIIVDFLGHFSTMVYMQKKLILFDTIDADKTYCDTALKVCQLVNRAFAQ